MITYKYINDVEGVIIDGDYEVMVSEGHPRWVEFLSGNPKRPADPTPEELRASMPTLTARQLRLALLSRLDDVEGIIEASGDRALQIEWEYATTFERLHPAIVGIGAALGLTPEEIDTMWLDAANT